MMTIETIKTLVRNEQYVYSIHAEEERADEGLSVAQVEHALLNGTILEHYPDTGRGESCLIVGFADEIPIHLVCGWFIKDGSKWLILITTYIPKPPKFLDPWTRGRSPA